MYKNRKIIAIIPARAGSKRYPGKNTRLMQGKQLILWTVEAAIKSQYIDEIIISTDDAIIIDMFDNNDAIKVIRRPVELATDSATTNDVITHVIRNIDRHFDYGILLQPTSPLRLAQDIDESLKNCIDQDKNTCASFVALPKPSNFYFAHTNNGIEQLPVYKDLYMLNGALYVFDLVHFMSLKTLVERDTLVYIMPAQRSVDIDTEEDFKTTEIIMQELDAGE